MPQEWDSSSSHDWEVQSALSSFRIAGCRVVRGYSCGRRENGWLSADRSCGDGLVSLVTNRKERHWAPPEVNALFGAILIP